MLKVKGLTKEFKLSKKQMKLEHTTDSRKIAVDDISFDVKPGEIFGLLGPNGAGKTTALRCISTLIKPNSGDILVDGDVSVVKEEDKARSYLSFLTNELKLEDHFTPNYIFNYFAKLYGLNDKEIEERKEILFKKFGVDKFKEVKISQLSTGMKQKISIAVSLSHNPPIIIFDEPTNGLDILTARTVTDYLEELRNEGKTIIISTHIMSVASKLCDRIGILIDGKIRTIGSLDEILKEQEAIDLEDAFFKIYKRVKADEGGTV
ncbi:ABC transporter ATP-binding protein [Haloplasma contractile]|uniref:ABC transporter ATP-binding protein-putative sodium extrusion ABC transporter n=1 Tax=Haloplasma contractile SSD-17B TaxID=1033810 RepID=U2EC03_9MOLU|nr:ATP-binding cassette domain-containing protein [Haloplasma contractile]ERJ12326.1 ABC transporter ATP-binding protein-putative sodium extrusion ABC transporter [Haloplasma contractile SSD-17B]